MKKYVYVIDTGYLTEYYKIPKHFNESTHQTVWHEINNAIRNKNRIYIPVPVIFEIANHIAHVKDENKRDNLAKQFINDIKNSLIKDSPFVLVPCEDFKSIENLSENLIAFAEKYAKQGLGLTDTSVYLQATQLNEKLKLVKECCVCILTTDGALDRLWKQETLRTSI